LQTRAGLSRRVPKPRLTPGERLRARRLALELTLRDVHEASIVLAEKHGNREFILPASRLHDIEKKGIVPNIFRLYTLSWVYGRKIGELLRWYGIPSR
jgi:hypothetical protein